MGGGPMGMGGPPGGGGGGGPGGPAGGGPPRQGPKAFMVTHQSFDALMADTHFGKAYPDIDDSALNAALLKKTQELTPTPAEQSSVQNLVSKVETVVEALILSSTGLNIAVDEVRIVGSYKKGTMLAGHPVADMVIILKETPGAADIENLAQKVQEKLKENTPGDEFPTQANEGGFNTTSNEGALVRVLVTTLPKNLFEVDPEKHVDVKLLEGALATIRHARWFEENASHTNVRVLVRILKDMKKRFAGLAGLTPWLIDLLSYNSATAPSNTRDPLSINLAFRRTLQLLSSGIFLPGSVGVIDPCESGQVRSHSVLGLEEQDLLCLTAQTLLRVLSHGAVNEILGVDGQTPVALDTDITSWGGTIVTPGQEAYNKEEHKKESLLDEEADEEAAKIKKDGEAEETTAMET
jgi:interleukin enhancer-binding factor 2